jgi:hypothetical protein
VTVESNKEVKCYKNGILIGTVELSGDVRYNSKNCIFIGAEPGGNTTTPDGHYFKGAIKDFRIYDRILSADEIAGLYDKEINKDKIRINKNNEFYGKEFQELCAHNLLTINDSNYYELKPANDDSNDDGPDNINIIYQVFNSNS